ncbi:hypothetical protein N7450_002145 [Penicillium hetheringtonii]|uniref:Uncharacterized protein n=1 Tax=Penicillium hetheringtonii TaxID=911720 RepID=A0AAD6DWQ1_9EURO|nr:hypothetical protein N7450_002145 [Penicillium hetheringtonii]
MSSHKGSSKDAPPAYEPSSPLSKAIKDAKALREATSGIRTDKKTLIQIIPTASLHPGYMALLQQTYTQLHQRDLEDDIRGHIPSDFKDTILGMIEGQVWSDVKRLDDLISEPVEERRVFTFCEIIFYRTPAKLQAIKQLYELNNSRPLAEFVRRRCYGHTAELLVTYLETSRCEDGSDSFDIASIRADTQLLHQGLWRQGKEDIEYVSTILAKSSRERIIALLDEFEAVYHVKLRKYAKEKTTGTFQLAVRLLLAWAEDPIQFARDCLVKLLPVQNRAAERSAITHTMLWAHWNRTIFETGKMRLKYTTSTDMRTELRKGIYDDSYRELILQIYDAKY